MDIDIDIHLFNRAQFIYINLVHTRVRTVGERHHRILGKFIQTTNHCYFTLSVYMNIDQTNNRVCNR